MTENRIVDLDLPEVIHALDRDLRRDGGEVRVVGGYLRDFARGKRAKDLDILFHDPVDDAMPMRFARCGMVGVDKPFGLPFLFRTTIDGMSIDLFRLGSFAPYSPCGPDWALDLSRRDFTMNAMSATLDGAVTDLADGWEHAEDGRVVWNGSGAELIQADPIRILRWIRFAANYGNTLDASRLFDDFCDPDGEETLPKLRTISHGRLFTEIGNIVGSDGSRDALAFMSRLGIHGLLNLPEPIVDDGNSASEDPFTAAYGLDADDVWDRLEAMARDHHREVMEDVRQRAEDRRAREAESAAAPPRP